VTSVHRTRGYTPMLRDLDRPHNAGRYVYGLQVRGLDDVPELCPDEGGAAGQTRVEVSQTDAPPPRPMPMDSTRGVRILADGRHLALDRHGGTATFFGPPLSPDLLAHPYLGPVATAFNRWAGREAFHGGAFIVDGSAWALVGPRTAGKSSLLAALLARNVPILSDDILITDGDAAYAGPRCLDLRQPIPHTSLDTTPSRGLTRWRVRLPPITPRVRFGGWVFLRWGNNLGLTPVSPSDLLSRVSTHRSWRQLPSDPTTILTLASLPAWELTRPRDWHLLDQTCWRLRSALSKPESE
jgi:hypothetical protein